MPTLTDDANWRALLRSLAEHDVYHTGQVALLKRLARRALAGSSTPPSR